jgi:hypothetical protein
MAVRILCVVLIFCYWLLVSQTDNQVSMVFDNTDFLWRGMSAILIAIATGFALFLLQKPHSKWTTLADQFLFTLPALLLVYRLLGFHLGGIAALLLTLAVSLGGIWALRKHVVPKYIRMIVFGTTVLIAVGLHVLLRVFHLEFSRTVGSINLALVFLSVVILLIVYAVQHPRFGAPILALCAISFIRNELSHDLAQVDYTNYEDFAENDGRRLVSLHEAFQTWLLSRNDLGEYVTTKTPYPVVLVASEGGGGYAAAHAYLFLSKSQERCPNFVQHTFALVGVSGGAIGNTQFHASLRGEGNIRRAMGCSAPEQPKTLIEHVRDDHLSPVLAAFLFQDAPNRILAGTLGQYDRSTALALSVTANLQRNGTNIGRDYFDHYWETRDQARLRLREGPALVHVATNAVSGLRYIFAPFELGNEAPSNQKSEQAIRDLNLTEPDEVNVRSSDISLVDAAVASASFPWITPSVRLRVGSSRHVTLVDGGYLDSSGAETVSEILSELMDINPDGNGIVLRDVEAPPSHTARIPLHDCERVRIRYAAPKKKLPDDAFSECEVYIRVHAVIVRGEASRKRYAQEQNFVADPVIALLNARQRRGETARYGLLSLLCGAPTCQYPVGQVSEWNYAESVIDPTFMTLPLGWDIPTGSLQQIYKAIVPADGDEIQTPGLQGSIHEIIDQQSSPFGTMADNRKNIKLIETIFEPPMPPPPQLRRTASDRIHKDRNSASAGWRSIRWW